MAEFFTNVLEFKKEDVKEYVNLSKEEIIQIMAELQMRGHRFRQQM